jgi:hypothetical protein
VAGDWIKMRGNLWDDPRVGRLSDLTGATEAQVIGSLYWLWTSADQHTENGFMPGLSLRQIDRKTGLQGFGAALVDIGWVEDGSDGITILNFSEHNGASAKRRCMDAQRKANDRAGVRDVSASDADKETKVSDESGQVAELEKEKSKSNTSTSLRSVEGAAGAKPQALTADEIIFGYGVPLLTAAGSTDKHARSFLGGLRKTHGDIALVDKLRDCLKVKPLQPLEWLAAALPPKPPPGKQAAVESRNAAVVAKLIGEMNAGG